MPGLEDQLTITITIGNGSGADALGPFFAPEDGLLTKAEADYRPADDTQTCGSCLHYGASSCNIVAGGISPEYTCDHWESESSADVIEINQGQTGKRRVHAE